jgi:hypothetical protein
MSNIDRATLERIAANRSANDLSTMLSTLCGIASRLGESGYTHDAEILISAYNIILPVWDKADARDNANEPRRNGAYVESLS